MAFDPTPRRGLAAWIMSYVYACIAAEISELTRYCGKLVQWCPRIQDPGLVLAKSDAPSRGQAETSAQLQEQVEAVELPLAVLLNGNTNHDLDIQSSLRDIQKVLARNSRVVLVTYNSYLGWLHQIAKWIRLRRDEVPTTFITRVDLGSLCRLAGLEVVRSRPVCYCPFPLGRWSEAINRVMALVPLIRNLSLAEITILRKATAVSEVKPSLTIVVPARNEKGNMQPLFDRLPAIAGCTMELIFVEGHSTDGTWEEILRLIPLYQERYSIKAFQQTGKGKADAVRVGFGQASGDLVTILDADLTMPPELLHRFYDAYCDGLGDFINGNRLTYPMEGKAMRFLNRLGNIFFAKAVSSVLEVDLGDTLCGTKLLSRQDYQRMCAWRGDFGDFDPFGDFELLFPAATLGLGIVNLPIRYRDRTYGETNISRFAHGWLLLRMTCIGLLRIRLAAGGKKA